MNRDYQKPNNNFYDTSYNFYTPERNFPYYSAENDSYSGLDRRGRGKWTGRRMHHYNAPFSELDHHYPQDSGHTFDNSDRQNWRRPNYSAPSAYNGAGWSSSGMGPQDSRLMSQPDDQKSQRLHSGLKVGSNSQKSWNSRGVRWQGGRGRKGFSGSKGEGRGSTKFVAKLSEESRGENPLPLKNDDGVPSETDVTPDKRPSRKTHDRGEENQRDTLVRQLTSYQYECMVCFVNIRQHVAIWHCDNCFHIFHLYCIKKWSNSITNEAREANTTASATSGSNGSFVLPSAGGGGCVSLENSEVKLWRCPACQKEHCTGERGFQYNCFCGKLRDPEYKPEYTPHSCGELCAKERETHCPHPCNILCHPGPCPPCEATISRNCHCGRTTLTLPCRKAASIQCEEVCGKALNCGQHLCQRVCHADSCRPCEATLEQDCHCGQTPRTVVCGSKDSFNRVFSCSDRCGRELDCGQHHCENVCHPGPCQSCPRLPENVDCCPCGESKLCDLVLEEESPRSNCLSPIPSCGQVCSRSLPGCGHKCTAVCHDTPKCPPCPLNTTIACRCGGSQREVSCVEAAELAEKGETFKCQRVCKKKKACRIHRCKEVCCVLTEHSCDLICTKPLSCGLHRCGEPCHLGKCPTCWMVNFSEATCECGRQKQLPPIACGEPPPLCDYPCSREHSCFHSVNHTCHTEPNCPPCTVLVSKICPGGHKTLNNIPCFQPVLTCGLICGNQLPGCSHTCPRVCHEGPCSTEDSSYNCKQPCQSPRPLCGHPCGLPCHGSVSCPSGEKMPPCRQPLVIQCQCGQKSNEVPCNILHGPTKYEMISAMSAGSSGESVNISSVTPGKRARQLPCDSKCSQVQRNQRMAEALSITNATVQPILGPPNYAKFLRDYALENFNFLLNTEKTFEELIKSAKEGKLKTRCFNFPSMNRDKRRFIHELSDMYSLETQSYDLEPKRSVTATAQRDKSFTPSVKLSSVLTKENPTLLRGNTVFSKPALLDSSDQPESNMCVLGGGRSLSNPWGASSAAAVAGKVAKTPLVTVGSSRPSLWSQLSREEPSTEGPSGTSPEPGSPEFDYFDMKPM